MPTTYILRDATSDLSVSGGLANKQLTTGAATTAVTQTLTFGNVGGGLASAGDVWGFTIAADPSIIGTSTGTYTVEADIATGSNNGRVNVALQRINSSGTAQSSVVSTEQTASAGTKTFTFTNPALGTWNAGDRLRVQYLYSNTSTMTGISLTIRYNTVNTEVIAPWNQRFSASGSSTSAGSAEMRLPIFDITGSFEVDSVGSADLFEIDSISADGTSSSTASADIITANFLTTTASMSPYSPQSNRPTYFNPTGWTDPANVIDASGATLGYLSLGSNQTQTTYFESFGFSGVGNNATLTRATVSIRTSYASTAYNPTQFQGYLGTTPIGSSTTQTLFTNVQTLTFTLPGVTLAQLQDPTFRLAMTSTRTSTAGNSFLNVYDISMAMVWTQATGQATATLITTSTTHNATASGTSSSTASADLTIVEATWDATATGTSTSIGQAAADQLEATWEATADGSSTSTGFALLLIEDAIWDATALAGSLSVGSAGIAQIEAVWDATADGSSSSTGSIEAGLESPITASATPASAGQAELDITEALWIATADASSTSTGSAELTVAGNTINLAATASSTSTGQALADQVEGLLEATATGTSTSIGQAELTILEALWEASASSNLTSTGQAELTILEALWIATATGLSTSTGQAQLVAIEALWDGSAVATVVSNGQATLYFIQGTSGSATSTSTGLAESTLFANLMAAALAQSSGSSRAKILQHFIGWGVPIR